MIITAPQDTMDAETVIVGAGTMGLALATALSAAGQKVLLIEAGGPVASTVANQSTTQAGNRPHRGTHGGRANGLGGTSTLWGGQLVEFDAEDFDRDYSSWPICRDDLMPWYRKVYQRLGVGSPKTAEVYRRRLGGEKGHGISIERFFTSWLPEPNFARLFRREALSDPSIRILCNATCFRIDFDRDTATRVGVRVDGRTVEINARRFVLAMGTIATVRFLLSTSRTGAVPWQGDDRIGRCFQDHLAAPVGTVTVSDEARFRNYFENAVVDGIKLQPKLRFSSTRRTDEPRDCIGISGYFIFRSDMSEHLSNLKQVARNVRSAASLASLRELPQSIWVVGIGLAPFVWRYVRDRRVMAFFDRSLDFQVQCEQIPLATSRIHLVGEAPMKDGLFRVAVDWHVDGAEISRIRDFALAVDAYLVERDIGRLEILPQVEALDPGFVTGMVDTNHQSGGIPMGSSHETGVVGPDLKVFGTTNLYVAGAAVFPTSSHANCTLTALALTERLAAALTTSTVPKVEGARRT